MAGIGLTQLPRKVAEHTGQPAPTYRRCFDAAVEARIPATFANGRWSIDTDADIGQIAKALGMSPAERVKPPRKARSALAAA